jgi:phage tail-like protein
MNKIMDNLLAGSHFQVEWGGTRIGFESVSGLEMSVDVIEYREGAQKSNTTQKMPGLKKYGNITLSRGVAKADNEFFEWWNTINFNTVEKRDIIISLLNEEHNPVVAWKVRDAFPVKVKWDNLEASDSTVFLEYLEIANEGIVVQNEG